MLNGFDVEAARDALEFLDSGCDRETWHTIGRAAIAAGITVDELDTWSATAPNYAGTKDVHAAFRTIKREGGTGPGTLIRLAKDAGWLPNPKPQQGNATKAARDPRKATEPQSKPRPGMSPAEVWQRCEAATPAHPYIVSKQGTPDGLRVVPAGHSLTIQGEPMAGALVVPVARSDGTLSSLQFVALPEVAERLKAQGKPGKLNLPHASLDGWFTVGELVPGGVAYVCEGIGQAWACWKATGRPAVVCFGWGRVRAVATELRKRDAAAGLVLVPDVGKESGAEKIARDLAAAVVVMPAGWPNNSDVNDLAQRDGVDALEALLLTARSPAAPVQDGVVVLRGDSLTPQPIAWLWHGWLALGKMHLLAGAPGQGKTTIAITFAATVTIGGRWPDGSRCNAGNVLIWSGEDDHADTLLPRLLAAGAEPSRVFFVAGSRINGELQSFDPARDMQGLQAQAERIGDVRLIIVDPVVSAVTGDSHKNTETRRALQPLVDLAGNMNAALLGITHFSKGGQGSDPAQRVIGSVAFTAVARVVLVAAKVQAEDGQSRRILARGKSNIGPDEGGYEYHLEQAEPLPGIEATRIAWGAAVEGTARELLTDPEEQDDGKTAVESAADFLREVLRDGVTPCRAIQAEGKDAGVSWASIRRAAHSLMVIKTKAAEGWYWKLPTAHHAQDAQHAQA